MLGQFPNAPEPIYSIPFGKTIVFCSKAGVAIALVVPNFVHPLKADKPIDFRVLGNIMFPSSDAHPTNASSAIDSRTEAVSNCIPVIPEFAKADSPIVFKLLLNLIVLFIPEQFANVLASILTIE
jgi:hypothetical protein